MKRATFVNFLSIMTNRHLRVRASVTMKETKGLVSSLKKFPFGINKEIFKPRFPIQAYRLFNRYQFKIKLVGLDQNRESVYSKEFVSDEFGDFRFKIPLDKESQKITALQIYEMSSKECSEVHLGTFIPLKIKNPKKIVICDFDKTLVDTQYSTTREIYHSLTSPLESFPRVTQSIRLLESFIDEGYHPFIVSSSPHFYEWAIRDWLYQNKIFTAGIFLKDYRRIFHFFEKELTSKDIKNQGTYKLNCLLDILLMTGAPHEILLIGDNFESDPLIYSSLIKLLKEKPEPRQYWDFLKKLQAFPMNRKQNSQLLNKLYDFSNQIKDFKENIHIKAYIRRKKNEKKVKLPSELNEYFPLFELYSGF